MSAPDLSQPASGYAREAILAAIARIAPLAVQLVATPFVIASAGVHAYAVWALLTTTINLMLTADLGVVGIMQRYHGMARGRGEPELGGRITATVLAVLVALLAVVTLLGPYIADLALLLVRVAPDVRGDAWELFRNAGTLAVLQLIGLAFGSYLAAHSRFAAMATASVVSRVLSAAAIAVALVLHAGLPGLLVAAYVDAGAAVLLGLFFCRRHLLREVRRLVYRSELAELWAYAWRNQASAVGFVAQRESDVLMAAVLLPAALQATVASSAQLSAAAALAPTVLLVPLFTRFSALAGRSTASAIAELPSAESSWFRFVLPFGALVVAIGPFLATAWLGPNLVNVTIVTALLSTGFVIALANSVRATLMRSIGRPGIETWSFVALLAVKLVIGIPATLIFGVVGLASSTVLAAIAAVVVLWRLSHRSVEGLAGGRPPLRSVFTALAIVVVGTPAGLLISGGVDGRWTRLLLLLAVAAAIAAFAAVVILPRRRRAASRLGA